jgi:hypothetical protein
MDIFAPLPQAAGQNEIFEDLYRYLLKEDISSSKWYHENAL